MKAKIIKNEPPCVLPEPPSALNRSSYFNCKVSNNSPANKLHALLPPAIVESSLLDEPYRDAPFGKVGMDQSFERSVPSSDKVGRSLAAEPSSNRHHHQVCDLSSNLPIMNDKIHNYSPELEVPSLSRSTSSSTLQDVQDPHALHFESHSSNFEHKESPKIEPNLEAFEDHVLTEACNLRDDFSCSSYSSSASCASKSAEFLSCCRIE